MSHTKVKTTYAIQGKYGNTEIVNLYCHHNHSNETTTFYNEDGSITNMFFNEWETDNDLWDAINILWFPFKNESWGGDLKDNVEYYNQVPWLK